MEGALLQHGAHGPVENEYTLLQNVGERALALCEGAHKCSVTQAAQRPCETRCLCKMCKHAG